jgi:hypothetical protein
MKGTRALPGMESDGLESSAHDSPAVRSSSERSDALQESGFPGEGTSGFAWIWPEASPNRGSDSPRVQNTSEGTGSGCHRP